MDRFVIDRFEGETVVLKGLDGEEYVFPTSLMPPDAKEGDLVRSETIE